MASSPECTSAETPRSKRGSGEICFRLLMDADESSHDMRMVVDGRARGAAAPSTSAEPRSIVGSSDVDDWNAAYPDFKAPAEISEPGRLYGRANRRGVRI
jgi:hypothetical protein